MVKPTIDPYSGSKEISAKPLSSESIPVFLKFTIPVINTKRKAESRDPITEKNPEISFKIRLNNFDLPKSPSKAPRTHLQEVPENQAPGPLTIPITFPADQAANNYRIESHAR